MVTYCCVEGCKNKTYSAKKESKGISFLVFPTNLEQRQKLLNAIGRPQWDPPNDAHICSEHLKINQIDHNDVGIWIKEETLPGNKMDKTCLRASNVEVCRICLAIDVKMFSLQHRTLKRCVETFTKVNDSLDIDSLPQFVCFECGAQLLKYNRLLQKSIIAQGTLLKILEDNGQVTKCLVKQKDRQQLKLKSSLGYAVDCAIINFVNDNDDSDDKKSDFIDHDLYNEPEIQDYSKLKPNNAKINLKRVKKNSVGLNKNTRKNNRINLRKPKKSSAENDQLKDKRKNVVIKQNFVNLIVKTAVAEYIDDSEKSNCNVQNITNSEKETLHRDNEPLKTESESPDYSKVENFDSEPEEIIEISKINSITENKTHEDKTFKTSSRGNKHKDLPQRSDKTENNEMMNENDTENVSDCDSSDSIDLLSLKNKVNKVKHFKNADDQDLLANKIITPARKKKSRDKNKQTEDSAIAKLMCYKIVDLSLQEQINAWKEENDQPTHYKDQVFQCEVCMQKFLREKAYEQHVARHKPERGDVECPVCRERFQSLTRLAAHTTRTHAKRYECTKCPKVFYNLVRARRHEPHHSGSVYACPHCAHSTRHRSAAWEHVRTQHAHAHHCARCGRAFITARGLAQHRAAQHTTEEEPKGSFPCVPCDVVFHSEGALRVHQFTSKLHDKPEPAPPHLPMKCKLCGESFARRRALWAHAQAVHGWVPRPTMRKRGVPLDRRTCEHCDKEVKTRFEYWCHLRRAHPRLKHTYRRVVTAVCDKCGQGFYNASLLKVHQLSHGAARHACALCPRVFHDPRALARHAHAHAPDRPHACPRCTRAFKLKGNLDRHMRTHTGETPYECSFCGKKFKYWGSMNEHEKHMHQKIPWPPRDRRAAHAKGADDRPVD